MFEFVQRCLGRIRPWFLGDARLFHLLVKLPNAATASSISTRGKKIALLN